jgi:hypothetical protein
VAAGLNTRDLVDPTAQPDADRLTDAPGLLESAEKLRELARPPFVPPKRAVLCLSGGGSYGAFSAGVLAGWTRTGTRPEFDVVTGISTGALIAPFAFLGPAYDTQMKDFYTTLESRDVFDLMLVRGLFSEALADNSPLARQVDGALTPELLGAVAAEHRKGRRLYVGTTELEGRRFVFWDVGEIAGRGTPESRELVKRILLGSAAIPGFFPASKIPVEVDGKRYVERHVDGGVSQALFFRRPYVPPELADDPVATSLYDSDVYAVVAGKLYADAAPEKYRSLSIAGGSVSNIIYAQTRGDLVRLWTVCQLTGMNFRMTAIPPEFPAPKSSTAFKPAEMTAMFNEGVRLAQSGTAWRTTPPGTEFGENALKRAGTRLTRQPRGGSGPTPGGGPGVVPSWPTSVQGFPVPVGPVVK